MTSGQCNRWGLTVNMSCPPPPNPINSASSGSPLAFGPRPEVLVSPLYDFTSEHKGMTVLCKRHPYSSKVLQQKRVACQVSTRLGGTTGSSTVLRSSRSFENKVSPTHPSRTGLGIIGCRPVVGRAARLCLVLSSVSEGPWRGEPHMEVPRLKHSTTKLVRRSFESTKQ